MQIFANLRNFHILCFYILQEGKPAAFSRIQPHPFADTAMQEDRI